MTEQPLMAAIGSYLFEAVSGLLAMLLFIVRKVYVRDAEKIDVALAGIRAEQAKVMSVVNDINATRPLRAELSTAVDDLRKEVAQEMTGLRSEIRDDINGLRHDMTTRLDTIIRLQQEKR